MKGLTCSKEIEIRRTRVQFNISNSLGNSIEKTGIPQWQKYDAMGNYQVEIRDWMPRWMSMNTLVVEKLGSHAPRINIKFSDYSPTTYTSFDA